MNQSFFCTPLRPLGLSVKLATVALAASLVACGGGGAEDDFKASATSGAATSSVETANAEDDFEALAATSGAATSSVETASVEGYDGDLSADATAALSIESAQTPSADATAALSIESTQTESADATAALSVESTQTQTEGRVQALANIVSGSTCPARGVAMSYADGQWAKVYRPSSPKNAVVFYGHGTNQAETDCVFLASVKHFVDKGFTVVTPVYKARSYMVRDVQANDVLNALNRAKEVYFGGSKPKLYLSGWSQGGFVTLAVHRALLKQQLASSKKAKGYFDFIASYPSSGPYDVYYTQKNGARIAAIDALIRDSYGYHYSGRGGYSDANLRANATAGNDIENWRAYGALRLCYGTSDSIVPVVNTTIAGAKLKPNAIVGISGADHVAAQQPCAQRAADWFATAIDPTR